MKVNPDIGDPLIRELGVRIANTRISSKKLEKATGFSAMALLRIFNGRTTSPRLQTVRAIADVLGYDIKLVRRVQK